MTDFHHETVLLEEAVDMLEPQDGGRYVDCTLGGAGHTARLLQCSRPTGRVLAIDQDPFAHQNARVVLHDQLHRVTLVRSNFRELRRIATEHGFAACDGILFDLGVSSPQFDEKDRGFSYRQDARLDMRMDPDQSFTAEDLINEWSPEDMTRIFYQFGEEKFAKRISEAIRVKRQQGRIESTAQLAEVVKEAIPAAARRSGPHPARRVFQAIRIAVNDELGALEQALDAAFETVRSGGRVSVITFHSLEDRIVKQRFAEFAKGCICPPDFPICQCHRTPQATLVTRKPMAPSEAEVERNPRARSAKLRVLQRV